MYCFHNISDSVRIDGIVDKLAISFGLDDTRSAEDSEVLGSHRLFESQLNVKFSDCQLLMFVQDAYDLLPEFVIQGPEDHCGLLQVDKIYFNCSIITRLGIEDHPIVTACTAHTVRLIEGLIKIICKDTS